MSEHELAELELATLVMLAEACNYSPSAHPPEHAITSRFPTHMRGDVKKYLKSLHKKGLALKHPTRGKQLIL
jgi:hypothetical protein